MPQQEFVEPAVVESFIEGSLTNPETSYHLKHFFHFGGMTNSFSKVSCRDDDFGFIYCFCADFLGLERNAIFVRIKQLIELTNC